MQVQRGKLAAAACKILHTHIGQLCAEHDGKPLQLAAAKSELLKALVGEVVATREIQMTKLLREVGEFGIKALVSNARV